MAHIIGRIKRIKVIAHLTGGIKRIKVTANPASGIKKINIIQVTNPNISDKKADTISSASVPLQKLVTRVRQVYQSCK